MSDSKVTVTLNENSVRVLDWYMKVWAVDTRSVAADNVIRIVEGRLRALEKYNSSPKGLKAIARAKARAKKDGASKPKAAKAPKAPKAKKSEAAKA